MMVHCLIKYYINYNFVSDENFPASEGIWGTDVFTAFELKTLTRRKLS